MPKGQGADPYADLRREIDAIDAQLLALLNRRAVTALEIGRRKRARKEGIYAPERERALLERLAQASDGPLDADAVRVIFQAILERSRALMEADGSA